jgi:SAM-dependent methyltransferase
MTRLLGDANRRRAYSVWEVQDHCLFDRVRMDVYRRGIEANVDTGDVVIDFGTGSGILAFIAARAGARKVYAIDEQPVEPARRVAAANGFEQIEFLQVSSRNFVPPEPVDAIIHANVDTAPYLSEPIVDDLRDLAVRALKPAGKLLPGRVDLYCEPAQLLAAKWIPMAWEHRVADVDFSALRDAPLGGSYPLPLVIEAEAFEKLLCEPAPVATVELGREPATALPSQIRYSRPAVTAGTLHGFVLYFVSHFDEANSFAARPLAGPSEWQLAFFRTEARSVRRGERISLDLQAPSYRSMRKWSWNWRRDSP